MMFNLFIISNIFNYLLCNLSDDFYLKKKKDASRDINKLFVSIKGNSQQTEIYLKVAVGASYLGKFTTPFGLKYL